MSHQSPFRPDTNPATPAGGFAILHGTLAPEGCVVRLEGFARSVFEGPARVFASAEAAVAAIADGRIRSSDMLVLRHEGRDEPLVASSGVEAISKALNDAGLDRVTVLTDGRIGSGATGAVIGHIAPTASAGGAIAYVNDDDIIHVDIAGRRIDILADIDIRRGAKKRKATFGALEKYAQMVSSAPEGPVSA
jgi:dihydroxy-acid dehydratase